MLLLNNTPVVTRAEFEKWIRNRGFSRVACHGTVLRHGDENAVALPPQHTREQRHAAAERRFKQIDPLDTCLWKRVYAKKRAIPRVEGERLVRKARQTETAVT